MQSKLEVFNQCNQNKSGYLIKETGFKKTWPKLYDDLNSFSFGDELIKSEFKIKLWHFLNDVYEIPLSPCGKKLKFKNFKCGYNQFCKANCQCSIEYSNEKRKSTSLAKYGVDHPNKLSHIKDKIKKTKSEVSKEEQEIINNKRRETCLEKWGVDNPNKNPDIVKQRVETFKSNIDNWKNSYRETSLKKWGVDHPFKVKEIHDKSKDTLILRYGENNPNKIAAFKEKIRSTAIKNWGVDHYFKSDEFKNAYREYFLKEYGVENPSQLKDVKKKISESVKKNRLEKLLKTYPGIVKVDDYDLIVKCKHKGCSCGGEYKISKGLFFQRNRFNIEPCIYKNPIRCNTVLENTVGDFLDSLGIEFIKNDRKILNGKELDFYIPSKNIAIEFNELYWHSELFKNKNYHIEKTKMCLDKGIQLIHIWEDDWKHKTSIIKNMIRSKLGLIKNSIGARKCEVREVNNAKAKEFLNLNHIQGYVPARTKLGLWYKDELVGLLTLGKTRSVTGLDGNDWELYRFAVKDGYTVPGGFSKLLSHFVKNNSVDKIITYSSLDYSTGQVYLKNGFTLNKITSPGYYWVIDGFKHHRYNFRKDKLVKEGADKNKSESQIMSERGYWKIWDSGNLKYEISLNI